MRSPLADLKSQISLINFQKMNWIIRKQTAWVLGMMLLAALAACQPQPTPGTGATPSLSQAVTASPVPATQTEMPALPSPTPPSRRIGPGNADQVAQQAQLGEGTVYGRLQFSPDGKMLAVPTTIGVDLYDAETLTKIRTLPTGGWTMFVAFSPGGNILATNSTENVIQLWDLGNGGLLRQLTFDSESAVYFMDLAFSPDGQTVAAGYGPETETWVWNVEDGKLLYQLKGDRLSYAADGQKLLTMHWDEAGTGKQILNLYDLSDGSQIKQWEGQRAVFSPSGVLAVEQDGTVRIWDPEKDQVTQAFNGKNVAFSAQGDRLALFSNKAIKIFNLTDGTLRQTLQGTYANVDNLLFSPDGGTLAGMMTRTPSDCCGGGPDTLVLWRITDGVVIKTMQAGQYMPLFTFTPEGDALAAPNKDQVDFLKVSDGAVKTSLKGYSPSVAGLAFSPDGQILAAASGGSPLSVQLWQVADSQPVQRLEDPGSASDFITLDVAFSPDGKTLVVRGDFWHLANGELMTEFQRKMVELHPFWPESVAFLPQGQTVALGSMEGSLSLWDFVDQEILNEFKADYTGQVISLDFSRDGTKLAAVYDYPDYVIQIWQVPEGRPLGTFSGKHFTKAIFSPDGQTLATVEVPEELENYGQEAGAVQLWGVGDGKELLQLDPQDVFCLAFAPDGEILATGALDGSIRLWQVSDGKLLQTMKGQTGQISNLAFSPDGTWLASSSLDGTVILWGLPDQ